MLSGLRRQMKRGLNPELDRKILDALAEKYHLMEKREGIHLSTLIGCLTRSYLDLKSPVELTDTELLLFSTGYGLQDVMTPKDAETPLIECDGVVYRPDLEFTLELDGVAQLVEMKSTRAGVKRYQEGDLPESWIIYMKAGCYIRKVNFYNLVVIYVAERPAAKIVSETLYFDEDEILDNWTYILSRRDIYKNAVDTDTIIMPEETWQCTNCRYNMQCKSITILESRKQAEKDIKELW